jgi:hypothetical protein
VVAVKIQRRPQKYTPRPLTPGNAYPSFNSPGENRTFSRCVDNSPDVLDIFPALIYASARWRDGIIDAKRRLQPAQQKTKYLWRKPNAIPFHVVLILIGRDALIAIAALLLMRLKGQRAFYSTLTGKVSTGSQVLTVLVVLILNILGRTSFILSWFYDATWPPRSSPGSNTPIKLFVSSSPRKKLRRFRRIS